MCWAGPIALPIIGSLIQVALADNERPFAAFHKLAKRYGNIMGLQLGSTYTGTVTVYLTFSSKSQMLF